LRKIVAKREANIYGIGILTVTVIQEREDLLIGDSFTIFMEATISNRQENILMIPVLSCDSLTINADKLYIFTSDPSTFSIRLVAVTMTRVFTSPLPNVRRDERLTTSDTD
jgi:hypothetical protein